MNIIIPIIYKLNVVVVVGFCSNISFHFISLSADQVSSEGGSRSIGAGLTVGGISSTVSVALLFSAILVPEGMDVIASSPSETDLQNSRLVAPLSSSLGHAVGSLRTLTVL